MSGGFEFNNLVFTATEKAVIIRRSDRKELPHLAIFFKTASGEIDGHLKDECAPPNTYPYTPLFQLPKGTLDRFLESSAPRFQAEFLRLLLNLGTVRPRSLANRGYVLGLIHDEPFESAVWETAPRKRGKYRVDIDAVKSLFENIDPSMISLLPPSRLHSDELKNWPKPIFAVRASGRDKLIALKYVRFDDSNYSWIRVDSIASELPRIIEKIVPPEIKKKTKDCWHRIHDAMQLHELGIVRD